MARYATNSWQAREALMDREPYRTGGSMYALTSAPYGHGRLNPEWAARYSADFDKIVYTVVSYSTPIAWVLDSGEVVKVGQKFSVTTSGHQGMLYALDTAKLSQDSKIGIREGAQRERDRARAQRHAREDIIREERAEPVIRYTAGPAPTLTVSPTYAALYSAIQSVNTVEAVERAVPLAQEYEEADRLARQELRAESAIAAYSPAMTADYLRATDEYDRYREANPSVLTEEEQMIRNGYELTPDGILRLDADHQHREGYHANHDGEAALRIEYSPEYAARHGAY